MQKLKQKLADTTAGVLACLDREHTESDLKEITTWWKEICSSKNPGIAVVNYTFAQIILMNTGGSSPLKHKPFTTFRKKISLKLNDPPEQHMLALLLYWPSGNEDRCIFDLSQLIQQMHCSYENTYKKHFRLRYLRPLFFLGKGQELNRTIHRKVLEMLFYEENQETKPDWSYNWRNENIFKNSAVQDCLLKVEGVVRNYRVYASVGGTEIEVEANLQRSLWRSRKVSFYLGFTIRGPVAFDIQTKTEDKGPSGGLLEARAKERDSSGWTRLEPEVKSTKVVKTYSLQSQKGHYECSVSALRWVCKDRVSFRYHYSSWEGHMGEGISKQYIPAGPLLDITVIAGKIEEVHLPHWICIDKKNIPPSNMFAVLHVSTCGNTVEQVSEVSSSHVTLLQPDFSPIGTILKMLGVYTTAFYDILIYKKYDPIRATLKLHVYMVPPDPIIKQ
ncbi:sterile alpha motif domain-containing protein 9-like [Melanotaenia boesemani]|uniref:sterile alpha motif domain-containing protein 9-like n=1 Tax=Melanotaenia boesemani TaxID=1250792 RepID=UPI001C0467C8|nr:sterile alpha motif domain-containing protein 9-like [Melanotaenia boesemani]